MIVDSSALIAILYAEPEAARFSRLLLSEDAQMSAANWLEAAMVAEGVGGPAGAVELDRLVEVADITLMPVTVDQAHAARLAFRRFGRGSGSRARLNFGDCFAYALSTTTGQPLLFKGDDFIHTDVLTAIR